MVLGRCVISILVTLGNSLLFDTTNAFLIVTFIGCNIKSTNYKAAAFDDSIIEPLAWCSAGEWVAANTMSKPR